MKEKIDNYRIEIRKADKSYDTANEQFKVVFGQIVEVEQKIIKVYKTYDEHKLYVNKRLDQFQKFESVIAPMHFFRLIQESFTQILCGEQFNNFVDYSSKKMWPELQKNKEDYDKQTMRVDLDDFAFEIEELEKKNDDEIVTLDKV